jgi:hypothetical protein
MDKTATAAALAFYNENYRAPVWAHLTGPRKVRVGKRNPQNCRYCRRCTPEVSFKKTAHTFPEMIGNRFLISCDECDSCNELFSRTVEDNFAKVTGLQRTASRVKGKGGVPNFKSNDGVTRWETKNGHAHIQALADDAGISVDEEKKELKFEAVRPPYHPRMAYKCLVKMALAVMPDADLPYYTRALDWLLIEKPEADPYKISCPVILSFVNGETPFPCITYGLLRRKGVGSICPFYIFLVAWSHYMYQIVVPFSAMDSHLTTSMNLPYFPNPLLGHPSRKVQYHMLDWSQRERVTNEKHSVTFVFNKVERTAPPTASGS